MTQLADASNRIVQPEFAVFISPSSLYAKTDADLAAVRTHLEQGGYAVEECASERDESYADTHPWQYIIEPPVFKAHNPALQSSGLIPLLDNILLTRQGFLPWEVTVYNASTWAPITPGRDVYRTILDAAGQVTTLSGNRGYELVDVVLKRILEFTEHLVDVDSDSLQSKLGEGMPLDDMMHILARHTGHQGPLA